MKWFRGAGHAKSPEGSSPAGAKTLRKCIGLTELMRDLRQTGEEKLCVLDLGPTSPTNIAFLTEAGHRVFNEDVLRASKDPDYLVRQPDGTEQYEVDKFFRENVSHPDGRFDAVLAWDVTDYLPEPLVKPLIERLYSLLKPKGMMLAFFHTKDAGPESPYSRYHIVGKDTLELEPGPTGFRLQRIFNNRHLENLYKDFASRKFFLGRDNIREVLIIR